MCVCVCERERVQCVCVCVCVYVAHLKPYLLTPTIPLAGKPVGYEEMCTVSFQF